MENVLEAENHKICEIYLEVLVYGKTFEELVENIQKVLQNFKQHGIKIKPEKCSFFKREVRYLGKIVTAEGH